MATLFGTVRQGDRDPQTLQHALLEIIRNNINTQYASQAILLAEFRDAVSTHGGTEVDATLLADFRPHVPLSSYADYKPFVDKFNIRPCKEEDVANMFSPGLPNIFVVSSATSGTSPKIFPKYNHLARLEIPAPLVFDPDNKDPLAALICTGYSDVKAIERAPGEVVQRIPVCIGTGGIVRRSFGWYTDDESRMSLTMSGYAIPWEATVIGYFPSFLIIHGLFFLAHGDVYHFHTPFATLFVDLTHHINKHWDVLVSCIRAHFHANPERAAELLEIGPPFSFEGCGPFAVVLSKVCGFVVADDCDGLKCLIRVRSILGPNVPIRCFVYASSEAMMGVPHDANKPDEFVLQSDDIVEFLDVSLDATRENLCQAWEVEVGKYYEPILMTRDGLWRYRLGDILCIVGFENGGKSPLFKYAGRRWSTIRLRLMQITDYQLLAAIQAFSSEDIVPVQEFAAMLDDRTLLPAVGFFIELAGPLGPNAHQAPQKLFDALVAGNSEHEHEHKLGHIRIPMIRIVKAGTFAEYRQWRGENANIPSGQIKVPLILPNQTAQEWILERVIQEL